MRLGEVDLNVAGGKGASFLDFLTHFWSDSFQKRTKIQIFSIEIIPLGSLKNFQVKSIRVSPWRLKYITIATQRLVLFATRIALGTLEEVERLVPFAAASREASPGGTAPNSGKPSTT